MKDKYTLQEIEGMGETLVRHVARDVRQQLVIVSELLSHEKLERMAKAMRRATKNLTPPISRGEAGG